MEGYMFFMNTETATETLKEGICFGIGEARYSDEQEKERSRNDTNRHTDNGNNTD